MIKNKEKFSVMLVIAKEAASPEHPTIPAILALVFSRNTAAKGPVFKNSETINLINSHLYISLFTHLCGLVGPEKSHPE